MGGSMGGEGAPPPNPTIFFETLPPSKPMPPMGRTPRLKMKPPPSENYPPPPPPIKT